jgi:hypothetical protein
VTVDDVEAAIDLVAGLAGRPTRERHDYGAGAVVVMTDPEGQEFCLVQYYSEASASNSSKRVGAGCEDVLLMRLSGLVSQRIEEDVRDRPYRLVQG